MYRSRAESMMDSWTELNPMLEIMKLEMLKKTKEEIIKKEVDMLK